MTVVGDDIVKVCRACYCSNGFGLRLEERGDRLVCPYDAGHQYRVANGLLERT